MLSATACFLPTAALADDGIVIAEECVSADGLTKYFISDDNRVYIEKYYGVGEVVLKGTVDNLKIDNYDFFECVNASKITKITFAPDASIACHHQYNKTEFPKLKTVVISEGIKEIPHGMFNNNDVLKTIYFPSTLKSVGDAAFYGTSRELQVYYNGTEKQYKKIEFGECTLLDDNIHFNDNTCYDESVGFNYSISGMKGIKNGMYIKMYNMNKKYTYKIQLSTRKDFKTIDKTCVIKNKKSVDKRITGLKSKKKYYYRIRVEHKKKGVLHYCISYGGDLFNIIGPHSIKTK